MAFVTPHGLFQFLVMSFGLTNAPAIFQRLMQREFNGEEGKQFIAAHLDDILVFSETLQDHLDHLRKVIDLLKLEFLHKCEKASHIPPGLRISLRPQVYAAHTSPANISSIIHSAQHDIIKALYTHYNNTLNNAQDKMHTVLTTISSSLPHLPRN